MPRNGSGTYNLPAGNPVVTQTLITSNWANTTMNDLAAAITQSLSKDGQTTPTANLPMGGFRHTGASDPASLDQYATLGFVQTGKAVRLTGVTGVNQIVGTLPGGASSLTVGQTVQLIPTSNNTGAVTININGIGEKPIKTDVGSDLAGGNLIAGRPYLLAYNGSEFVLVYGGGTSAVAQAAMSGWDRPTPTGPYPELTIVNPTTVHVPAGHGRIIKPSARDLSGVTEVSWPAQDVTISAVASTWSTVLGVNSAGNIVQFTGGLNSAWARDNILLGTVAHINGTVNDVITRPAIFGDMTYGAYDLTVLFHNSLISGGRIFPNGVNPFHVDIEAGSLFSLGADSSEVNSPNIVDFPDMLDISFFPVTGTSGVSAITQNVPVTNYDPGGTGVITPIPGGASTAVIHRLYFLAGQFLFLYGQNTYGDLATALSSISLDSANTQPPAKLANATLLGYIIAQKNTTDLKNSTQARLVSQGGFDFSIGSAGSISDAPINGLTYGRKDAAWVEATPLPKGPQATLRMDTYYTNTFPRFAFGLNDTPETGSNIGSDMELRAFNDAGTLTGTCVRFDRATRKSNFLADMSVLTPTVPAFLLGATGNAADKKFARLHIDTAGDAVYRLTLDSGANKTQIRLWNTGGLSLEATAGVPQWLLDPVKWAADFTTSSLATRTKLQTLTTNGLTDVTAQPNGTAAIAAMSAVNSSGTANYGGIQIKADATLMALNSFTAGSGTLRDIAFTFNGTENARLTSTNRYQANFNNADVSLRHSFQATSGSVTAIQALPPTGGTDASWVARSDPANPNNTHGGAFGVNATQVVINSLHTGTGTTRPISFQMDGSQVATLSTSGQLNLNGALVTAQSVNFNSNLISTAANAIVGTGSAGNVILRPNTVGSATGEVVVASTGDVTMNGPLRINGGTTNNPAALYVYRGVTGGQSIISGMGYSNGVNRWQEVLEADATLSWYAYDTAGTVIRQAMYVQQSGVVGAVNFVASSDERLKRLITPKEPRRTLPDLLQFVSYVWRNTAPSYEPDETPQLGLIAQQVKEVAPEYVVEGPDGTLAIDKIGLLTECVVALAKRVAELEAKV